MKHLFFAASLLFPMALAAAPAFPGGTEALDKYLAENLKYPDAAKSHGIEGVVSLSFTVKADGSIGAIKIDRMIDPDLEQEAIRLVKNMPAWQPEISDGKPVDAQASLSIPFTIDE